MLKQAVSRVPVEQVVGRDFDLHRAGERYYRAVKHNSLVVDTEKNRWYWNSLGVSGNALDWLTKIRGYSVADSLEILQNYTKVPLRRSLDILFEPQLPYPKLLQAFYQLGKKKRDYWYTRGYTDDTIDLFMLGYTGKHYVIPIIDKGVLLNFQCRTPEKRIWNWTKNSGKQAFNFSILPSTTWVILTESPVDAIIATQYGFPAVSIFPNSLVWDNKFTKYFAHLRKIYMLFDNDKAGWRGMKKLGKMFPNRAWVADWEGYPTKWDVGDFLKGADAERIKQFSLFLDRCLPADSMDSNTKRNFYRMVRDG